MVELREWFVSQRLSARIIETLIVMVAIVITINFFQAYLLTPSQSNVQYEIALARANSAAAQGNETLAIQEYTRATVLNPYDSGAYFARGKLYLAQGEDELALHDLQAAIQLGHDDDDVYFYRAKVNLQLGNYDNLSGDFIRSGRTTVALSEITDALESTTLNPAGLYVARGDIHTKLYDYESAIQDYNNALDINPQYFYAYTGRARAHRLIEKSEAANADEAIAQARLNYSASTDVEILTELTDANLSDSQMALVYYNRAMIRSNLGEYDDAILDYKRAVELDPQMHDAYMGLGYVYAEMLQQQELAGADFYERMRSLNRLGDEIETTMEIGDTTTIEMAFGRIHKIVFEGTQGDTLTIRAEAMERYLDPLIVLLDPDGNPIIGDDDVGKQNWDSLIVGFELPEDGAYSLWVSHANAGSEGEIRVSIR